MTNLRVLRQEWPFEPSWVLVRLEFEIKLEPLLLSRPPAATAATAATPPAAPLF